MQAVAVAARVGFALALLVDYFGLGFGEEGGVLELLRELRQIAVELGDLPEQPRLFTLVVLQVISRVRLGEALAAPRLQLRLAAPHRRKRVERLHFAALRARSHEGERAVASISRE